MPGLFSNSKCRCTRQAPKVSPNTLPSNIMTTKYGWKREFDTNTSIKFFVSAPRVLSSILKASHVQTTGIQKGLILTHFLANKNAFESSANHPRKSTFPQKWHWLDFDLDLTLTLMHDLDLINDLWPHTKEWQVETSKWVFFTHNLALDTQTRPRYGNYVTSYEKWNSYVKLFRQTDRHDWKHYLYTYMGGNNIQKNKTTVNLI